LINNSFVYSLSKTPYYNKKEPSKKTNYPQDNIFNMKFSKNCFKTKLKANILIEQSLEKCASKKLITLNTSKKTQKRFVNTEILNSNLISSYNTKDSFKLNQNGFKILSRSNIYLGHIIKKMKKVNK
jgi:hypothetical protein